MRLHIFLINLIANGRCCFTYSEVKKALHGSDIATRAALRRLKQKGELAQPSNGFYVIVPPEYRILKCRPADQFIHELMQFLGIPYYIGLLSATQYHGAAHHRPQQFQVMIHQKRRLILCGQVKIVFITKKNIKQTPTQFFNTSQGKIIVSTPEITAIDLVNYPNRCGGLDNISTILIDLAKKINVHKLQQLAIHASEITWIQRLGYLLDLIQANKLSDILLKSLNQRRVRQRDLIFPPKTSPLAQTILSQLNKKKKQSPKLTKNHKWKLIINKKWELEK